MIGWPRRAEDVTVLGPVVAAGLFPIDGGAEGVDGLGVAALEAGSLSHEEKKSSSLGGAGEARGVSSRPSMWIPCGFLTISGVHHGYNSLLLV